LGQAALFYKLFIGLPTFEAWLGNIDLELLLSQGIVAVKQSHCSRASSNKFSLGFQRQQPIEKGAILFQGNAEIFCRGRPSAIPLLFEGTASVGEIPCNILNDIRNQVIRLFHRLAWVIYKFTLDRQPAGVEFLGFFIPE
jgi:hypothetical protein